MAEINKLNYDLEDVIFAMKNNIFSTMNCIKIGKIEKVTTSEQTIEAQIQWKVTLEDGTVKRYPLLIDCPFFVLQGGGAFLDMPIKAGDYCILLFNDRDISNWLETGAEVELNTNRKHSLSDAIALVGINPSSSALALDGNKVILDATDFNVEIKGLDLTLLEGTDFAVRYNELETAFNQLKSDFDALVTDYNSHTHPATTTATVGPGPTLGDVTVTPTTTTGSPTTADITPAKCDKINLPGVGE